MENSLIDTVFVLGGGLITIMGGIIIYFLKGTLDTLNYVKDEQQKQAVDIAVIKEKLK